VEYLSSRQRWHVRIVGMVAALFFLAWGWLFETWPHGVFYGLVGYGLFTLALQQKYLVSEIERLRASASD
jgi:hypothetical protein